MGGVDLLLKFQCPFLVAFDAHGEFSGQAGGNPCGTAGPVFEDHLRIPVHLREISDFFVRHEGFGRVADLIRVHGP